MSLDFSQPGEKEIRNSYKSGGRARFYTGLFPPIHISEYSFSYTEYFAPNFERALPSCILTLAPLNKAVVSLYKNPIILICYGPRLFVVQVGVLLVSNILCFPKTSAQNYFVALRVDIAASKSYSTLWV